MRRNEFKIENINEIEEILESASYGTLSMAYENEPYAVSVNFVYVDKAIYFHSALTGKKVNFLKQNPKVFFSVVKEASFIPSYFSDSEFACPASVFFQSVFIDGKAEFIIEADKKAETMNSLMQKFQPEGKYKEININDEKYLKALNAMALIKIVPNEISAKFKLGQNLSKEKFEHIINELSKRGERIDSQTIKLMQKFFKDK